MTKSADSAELSEGDWGRGVAGASYQYKAQVVASTLLCDPAQPCGLTSQLHVILGMYLARIHCLWSCLQATASTSSLLIAFLPSVLAAPNTPVLCLLTVPSPTLYWPVPPCPIPGDLTESITTFLSFKFVFPIIPRGADAHTGPEERLEEKEAWEPAIL